jgi:xylitol oxidase
MTVSVTGGTRYGVLAAQLQSQGYALHNTGSLPHISVAGATATGTHGSGDRNKILSTAVAAVDLVTADGSLLTIDRASPDLKAVAVGLGAFGVITRLVLDVQPTYLVRQDVYRDAPWDTVLEALDEVMASAYSVSLIGDLGSPRIRELWQKTRVESVEEDHDPPPPVPESLHGGTWYDDAEEPPGHSLNVRGGVPGPWSERLPHFRLDAPPSAGGDELQTEYFVDRRYAVDAIRILRSLGDRISPHLHAAELRTAAADDLAQPRLRAELPVHRLHLAQASGRGHGPAGRHRGRARAVRAATPLGQAVPVHPGGPGPPLPPAAGVRRPDTDLRPHRHVLQSLPRAGRHQKVNRMVGRAGDERATSTNPAAAKVEA